MFCALSPSIKEGRVKVISTSQSDILAFMTSIPKVTYKPNSCNAAEHHCKDCHDEEIPKVHKEHECNDASCSVAAPHGHPKLDHNHDSCMKCMKDHLCGIFPLEGKITNLKISNTVKQVLLNVSYLTPAIIISKLSSWLIKPLFGEKVAPYLVSPLAVSSMYFANKGTEEKHKPLLISASSVGIIGLQQLTALPRWFMRPFMALAVDLINKSGKSESVGNKKKQFIGKEDLIKHGRLQAIVNIVPPVINFFLHKLEELNHSVLNPLTRFLGSVGITFTQVLSLSCGFLGLGFVFDKVFEKFKLSNNEEENLAAKTESTVCACCGAPFCVAEAVPSFMSLAA